MDIRQNNFINPNLVREIENSKAKSKVSSSTTTQNSSGNSFASVLDNLTQSSEKLQMSKHASQRLMSRNVTLSNSQMERVEQGVSDAKDKGINEGLVLVDDVALLVSMKKNTIITVMNNEESKSKVFTNIDGAVIV
ncbi:MAG: TIGR02530 family flagellar biosynthesis protein [Lachnospirales bacterium]